MLKKNSFMHSSSNSDDASSESDTQSEQPQSDEGEQSHLPDGACVECPGGVHEPDPEEEYEGGCAECGASVCYCLRCGESFCIVCSTMGHENA